MTAPDQAQRERGRLASPNLAQAPFADWCEPGEILCLRPEECRKCPGRVLVGYLLDDDGSCYGWGARPLGHCGNPDRCGDKVLGITPAEAFGWGARP
jgi:hypothetical protein